MKFLLTALLSLSFVTNAFSLTFSSVDTFEFVKGCRGLVKTFDEGTDIVGGDRYDVIESVGYLSGYLDSRSVSVIRHLVNTNADRTDYELVEKELYQYVLPENFTVYILAKLIVNNVDSSPAILTKKPYAIVTNTLRKEFLHK